MNDLVFVGRLVKPHGVRGQVKVQGKGKRKDRFYPGLCLWTTAGKSYEVLTCQDQGETCLLKLSGIESREAAEALVPLDLYCREKDLAPLPPGAYYVFQLQGLEVRDPKGRILGTIIDVSDQAANDNLVIQAQGRTVMVPALAPFISEVHLEEGYLVINPIEGMFDAD